MASPPPRHHFANGAEYGPRVYSLDWVLGTVTRKLHGCFIVNFDVFAHKTAYEGELDCCAWFENLHEGDVVEFLADEFICGRNNWRASCVRDPQGNAFGAGKAVPVPFGFMAPNVCPPPYLHHAPAHLAYPPPFAMGPMPVGPPPYFQCPEMYYAHAPVAPFPFPQPHQPMQLSQQQQQPHHHQQPSSPQALYVIVSEPTIVSPSTPESSPCPLSSLRSASIASSLENNSDYSDAAGSASVTTSFGSPQEARRLSVPSPSLAQLAVASLAPQDLVDGRFGDLLDAFLETGDSDALLAALHKETPRHGKQRRRKHSAGSGAGGGGGGDWRSRFVATALLRCFQCMHASNGRERSASASSNNSNSTGKAPKGGSSLVNGVGRPSSSPSACTLLQDLFLQLHTGGSFALKDFRVGFVKVASVLDALAGDSNPQAHHHASVMLAHAIHFGYLELDTLRQILTPLKLSGKALTVALLTFKRVLTYCDVDALASKYAESTFELGDVIGDISDKEIRSIVEDMGLTFLIREQAPEA